MNTGLGIRDSLGERRVQREDLPLSIGGAGCAIALPELAPQPLGWIGLHNEELFVQGANAGSLLHNGVPVEQSVWLRVGDVITAGAHTLQLELQAGTRTLVVRDGMPGNATAPPAVAERALTSGSTEADIQPISGVRYQRSAVGAAGPRRKRRPLLAVGATALVIAALLWFLMGGVAVQILTEPADARVRLADRWLALHVGDIWYLRPGEHEVLATKDGYRPLRQRLTIADRPAQSHRLQLASLPGKLRIEVPARGMVRVDGGAAQDVPATLELEAGARQLAFEVPGHLPLTVQVKVAGEGKLQQLQPALVPDWAQVSISSEPAGAQVLVDGKGAGSTPATLPLKAGTHSIELRQAGFRPWTSDVLVKANQPQTIGPVRLGLPDATLSVQSKPAAARVTVGGVYRGVTPLTIALRPGVASDIELAAPGHTTQSRTLRLDAGERSTLQVELQAILGAVTVRSNHADAEVFVDGASAGRANTTLSLPAIEHRIEVRKAGFLPHEARVVPRPDLTQVIEATLRTESETRIARAPPTIRAADSIELRLMPIGRFTMGSDRREPGRRANEAPRAVELKRPFYLGVREITNAEFRRFRASHQSGLFGGDSLNLDKQPVVNVSWQDAAAFCNWLSQQEGLPPAYQQQGGELVPVSPMTHGYRLPTEAEWEWAARRRPDGSLWRYPWGDALPVTPRSGNYADAAARAPLQDVVPDYDDGFVVSAPVGSFAASSAGLHDLGGNVAEWTSDLYASSYAVDAVPVDPLNGATGNQHVVRGASWRTSSLAELRSAMRAAGAAPRDDLGFRIARYAE